MQMTKIVYQIFLTYISSQGEGGRRLRAVRDEAQQTEQQVINRLPDLVFDWYTDTHHSSVLLLLTRLSSIGMLSSTTRTLL